MSLNIEIFSIKMSGRVSTLRDFPINPMKSFNFRKNTTDAIKNFRKLLFEKYPGFEKRLQAHPAPTDEQQCQRKNKKAVRQEYKSVLELPDLSRRKN
ncbi:MAG: hypothetical protein MZV64_59700 [Ignavibacteriales bacterium]|nr:hypothetical protein [Ignavibacteriales bacterium]